MSDTDKNWAEQLGDIVDKAVDSAKQAWDGTETSRVSLMDSVKKAANDVAAYAVEATEATKEAWHRDDEAAAEDTDEATEVPADEAEPEDVGAEETEAEG